MAYNELCLTFPDSVAGECRKWNREQDGVIFKKDDYEREALLLNYPLKI